jgi:hypothetical protein
MEHTQLTIQFKPRKAICTVKRDSVTVSDA